MNQPPVNQGFSATQPDSFEHLNPFLLCPQAHPTCLRPAAASCPACRPSQALKALASQGPKSKLGATKSNTRKRTLCPLSLSSETVRFLEFSTRIAVGEGAPPAIITRHCQDSQASDAPERAPRVPPTASQLHVPMLRALFQ
eukprot:776876-Rhodomonas_salina.5